MNLTPEQQLTNYPDQKKKKHRESSKKEKGVLCLAPITKNDRKTLVSQIKIKRRNTKVAGTLFNTSIESFYETISTERVLQATSTFMIEEMTAKLSILFGRRFQNLVDFSDDLGFNINVVIYTINRPIAKKYEESRNNMEKSHCDESKTVDPIWNITGIM
uniref:Uncharacterized protein n=1 Tax=Romanomermis culicivorax TaxID=13658 RepID=A0A915I7B8_ROMCU